VLRAERESLAQAISGDFGHRSRHETMIGEVVTTLSSIRHTTKHLRRWMTPERVSVNPPLLPARAEIMFQPKGVVGIISPWNYPLQLALLPLAQAVAAGNRVMLKPSEKTPKTSVLLRMLLAEVFDESEVAVVLGGPDVGEAFSHLPFDHLLYTGSTAIGRQVMRAAAGNLTPVTLELGGKSPAIVAEDADLARAAESIAFGKFLNAGQTCVAPDYVLVSETKREAFTAHLEAAVRKLYPTIEANPDYTALIDQSHYDRIRGYVAQAKAAGARIIAINPASEILDEVARKFPPTLVIQPNPDLLLMGEEIFGPVLPIIGFSDSQDAIGYVNARPRPLALYYFGADETARDEVLARTTSGGVAVNDTLLHVAVDGLPFGGIGASGMGAYHGRAGFETFCHKKSVFYQSRVNFSRLSHPPYGRVAGLLLRLLVGRQSQTRD
jgi:coniferyl-aldehyde dehydrogenase